MQGETACGFDGLAHCGAVDHRSARRAEFRVRCVNYTDEVRAAADADTRIILAAVIDEPCWVSSVIEESLACDLRRRAVPPHLQTAGRPDVNGALPGHAQAPHEVDLHVTG